MKQVTVKISTKNEITIDVEGNCGPACADLARSITDALQAKVTGDTKKPEFYAVTVANDSLSTGY